MAVFNPLEVKRGLAKLRPIEEPGKHIVYKIYDDNGTFLGTTHISHSTGDIDDNLLGLMARQLKITSSLLKKIIGCTKGRAEYIDMAGS